MGYQGPFVMGGCLWGALGIIKGHSLKIGVAYVPNLATCLPTPAIHGTRSVFIVVTQIKLNYSINLYYIKRCLIILFEAITTIPATKWTKENAQCHRQDTRLTTKHRDMSRLLL